MSNNSHRISSDRLAVFLAEALEQRILLAVVTAGSADDFVSSLGVATHLAYTSTPYGDFAAVKSALDNLNIRNIRDGFYPGASQAGRDSFVLKMNELYNDLGIMLTTGSLDMRYDYRNDVRAMIDTIKAFEGVNEPDLSQYKFIYEGNGWNTDGTVAGLGWAVGAKNFMEDLQARIDGDVDFQTKPLINFALGWGGNSDKVVTDVGSMEPYCDYGNFHYYTEQAYPPEQSIQGWHINNVRKFIPNDPLWVTEAGYKSDPATSGLVEDAHACYTLRIALESWRKGVEQTFLYELVDSEGASGPKWGLMRADWTPKPAYTSMQNLINLLADPGTGFTPGQIDFTLTDLSGAYPEFSEGLRNVVLQKADGTFYIVVWHAAKSAYGGNGQRIAVADRTVQLNLSGDFASASLYEPLGGSASIATYNDPTQLTLSVADHPLVIELTPQPPTPPPGNEVIVYADAADVSLQYPTWKATPKDGSVSTTDIGAGSDSYGGSATATFIGSGFRNSDGNPAFEALIPFQLPTLTPGQQVNSIVLQVKATGTGTNGMWGSHDLYGLGGAESLLTSPSVLNTMGYWPATSTQADTTNATLLANQWITEANFAVGNTYTLDVTDYVLGQLGANYENAGKYIFFRISPDVKPAKLSGVYGPRFGSANAVSEGDRPQLVVQLAPTTRQVQAQADAADVSLQYPTWKATPKDGSVSTTDIGAGSDSYGGSATATFIGSGFRNSDGNPAFEALIPFQLPVLAPGESIQNATLTLKASGTGTNGMWGSHDLYGLAGTESALASPAVLNAMGYWPGTSTQADTTNAVLLANQWITEANFVVGNTYTIDVTEYVASQYGQDNVNSGKYIFFRLCPDVKPAKLTGVYGPRFASANATVTTDRPTLNLTIASTPAIASDGFESGDGLGGSGWSGAWTFAGSAGVIATDSPEGGTKHLRLSGAGASASRAVDLSGQTSAQLSFAYKASSFEAGESVAVQIYNGSTWQTVLTVADGADDGAYHIASIDLSSYTLTAAFAVRFTASFSAADDLFYVDEIRILA